jgi:FkbM family methyltransferase
MNPLSLCLQRLGKRLDNKRKVGLCTASGCAIFTLVTVIVTLINVVFPSGTRSLHIHGLDVADFGVHTTRASCDRATRDMYAYQQGSSASISLNVSHLAPPYNKSRGWLSQRREDRWLYEHFFHDGVFSGPGTFLELGALDGIRYSNSYIFEKALQWKGVLIEASTPNFAALEENRGQGSTALTLHAAICEHGDIMEIYGSGATAGETVVHSQKQQGRISRVPCIQINDVLRRFGISKLDLLSLDVEGMELVVLEQLDFQAVQTFVILVEMRPVDESSNPSTRKYLYEQGFCMFAQNVGANNEVWINPKYS